MKTFRTEKFIFANTRWINNFHERTWMDAERTILENCKYFEVFDKTERYLWDGCRLRLYHFLWTFWYCKIFKTFEKSASEQKKIILSRNGLKFYRNYLVTWTVPLFSQFFALHVAACFIHSKTDTENPTDMILADLPWVSTKVTLYHWSELLSIIKGERGAGCQNPYLFDKFLNFARIFEKKVLKPP